jgi:glycosyltransferase involved in cell wall biosynthesis
VKGHQPTVCMIAYTSYATDARVRREAETLAAHGFDVVCLTNRNGTQRGQFVLDGVKVRELGVPKYRGKSTLAYLASYLRFLAASSVACVRLVARGQLDIVHVHNIPDFLVFAGLLPRAWGAKVVLDIHDSMPETFAAKFSHGALVDRALRLEERVSARVAHRVVCVNHPQRDTLTARGIPAAKTFISMNVPDPRIFAGVPGNGTPGGAGDGTFNLVYHGTMVERLGVDLLIRAVALLREELPDLRLHLWGNGDDLPRFQQLASKLHVGSRVLFRPQGFPLHELPGELARMDLCLVGNRPGPAGDLMLPVKLLECVALGLPAVVPRLRTIQYYFTDEMVTYFDPGDVGSLAAGVRGLHGDAARRREQAEKARGFLVAHGWERQGVELVSLYRELLAN